MYGWTGLEATRTDTVTSQWGLQHRNEEAPGAGIECSHTPTTARLHSSLTHQTLPQSTALLVPLLRSSKADILLSLSSSFSIPLNDNDSFSLSISPFLSPTLYPHSYPLITTLKSARGHNHRRASRQQRRSSVSKKARQESKCLRSFWSSLYDLSKIPSPLWAYFLMWRTNG